MQNEYVCEKIEGKALYKIGLFAQMNRVTIKALRHYDEIGLLKPECIDESTGYRFYTSDQLPILHEIVALRQMGMSLEEIGRIQKGNSIEEVLTQKKVELIQKIAEDTMKLSQVEYYLSHKGVEDKYHVLLKEIPEVIIASMRTTIDSYDDLFRIVPPMGQEMERLGCECAVPEYCFNIYHDKDARQENIDVEVCEAVTEIRQESEMVKFRVLPRVEQAACVLHRGHYAKLPMAYGALMKWIEENGYEQLEAPRESYIDGAWNKDTPEEWLTEIQFPVKKIQKTAQSD